MHIRPDTMETLHSHSVVEMFEELKKSTQFVQNHLKLQKPFFHLQYAEVYIFFSVFCAYFRL